MPSKRLLGTNLAEHQAVAPWAAAPRKPSGPGNGSPTANLKIAAGENLTREKLEGPFWLAADLFRDSIDSSDDNNYILSMMLLKRLSDRFQGLREPKSSLTTVLLTNEVRVTADEEATL